MEEVTLRAVKRAMPGHGRARIHSSLLTTFGIEDNGEVEVVGPAGVKLTLTIFADSLVEKGQIRISEDDLNKLGIPDGGDVVARRKIPVSEQVKAAASDFAGRVNRGLSDLGETVSDKTGDLKDGTMHAAHDLQEKAKEVSSKIADEVGPIGEKISDAGRETAAKIQNMVPTARFSAAVETGLKRLKPGDAADLKKIILQNEGDIRAVRVTLSTAAGRTIQNLTLPPEVIVAAIQREDNTLVIPASDTVIYAGDIVYLIGKEKGLNYMTTLLEG
ncbi:MAG: TrkA C-terminal domain-containing protein [Methanobacteriota archaeon]